LNVNWELVRLSLGAFLTSSGLAGVAAVTAALIAANVAGARLRVDRILAAQQQEASQTAAHAADARARWWETVQWLWLNRAETNDLVFLEALQSLKEMVETRQQSVMLEIVTRTLIPEGE
jgi:hypothetical protein